MSDDERLVGIKLESIPSLFLSQQSFDEPWNRRPFPFTLDEEHKPLHDEAP
ncbi:MAG: hypothetical protein ACKV2Q_08970 [Planctomycetaceae bacterium]